MQPATEPAAPSTSTDTAQEIVEAIIDLDVCIRTRLLFRAKRARTVVQEHLAPVFSKNDIDPPQIYFITKAPGSGRTHRHYHVSGYLPVTADRATIIQVTGEIQTIIDGLDIDHPIVNAGTAFAREATTGNDLTREHIMERLYETADAEMLAELEGEATSAQTDEPSST